MTTQPPKTPIGEMMTWASIATQLYGTALEQRLAAHGLTGAQLSVLSHLARHSQSPSPAQGVSAIARAVQVQQPAVTKMMTKFAREGWITLEADPKDARKRNCRISRPGLSHLGTVQRDLFPDLGRHFADWSEADMARFTADLKRFAAVFDAMRRLDATSPSGLSENKQTGL